jgi:hypothetical protein
VDKNQIAEKGINLPLILTKRYVMKKLVLSVLGMSFAALGFSQTQVPNIDFENWETLNGPISNQYEEPEDWSSSNECTAIINQFAVTKSTDAQSGNYSVRMETFQAFGNIRANGIVTTSQMICLADGGGQEGGMAYTDMYPDSLTGWFKYAPVNNDSAYCQIMWLSNNDMDTTCFTRIDFHAAAEWTRFSVPLCPGEEGSAEKLSMLFSSSWGDGSQGEAEVGSVFFLDNIAFANGPIGIDEAQTERTWTVYPNPVQGELNVQVLSGQEANIEIIDVTGKLVKKERVSEMNHKIDVSQLVTGIYLYQIRSLDKEVLRTGKLLVNP